MSSNSNTPVNEKIQKLEEESSVDADEKQTSSYTLNDYESVNRSGIDVMTQNLVNFTLQAPEIEAPTIPSLPEDLPYETVATRFVHVCDLQASIGEYFDGHENATCILDEDSTSKLYIVQQFGEDESTRLVMMVDVYRNDVNDELHLYVNRVHGCGIQFAQFYKDIADQFSVKTMNIWTLDQPTLLALEDDKEFTYNDIPLYASQTEMFEGLEVIVPLVIDDEY